MSRTRRGAEVGFPSVRRVQVHEDPTRVRYAESRRLLKLDLIVGPPDDTARAEADPGQMSVVVAVVRAPRKHPAQGSADVLCDFDVHAREEARARI